MPVTEVHIFELPGQKPFCLQDKYGLSTLRFKTEEERQSFINSFPEPTPKISKGWVDCLVELYAPKSKKGDDE